MFFGSAHKGPGQTSPGKKGRGGDEDTGGKRKYYVKNRGYSFLTRSKGSNGTLMKGILMWTEQLEKTAMNSFSRQSLKSFMLYAHVEKENVRTENLWCTYEKEYRRAEQLCCEKRKYMFFPFWLLFDGQHATCCYWRFNRLQLNKTSSWECLTEEYKKEI